MGWSLSDPVLIIICAILVLAGNVLAAFIVVRRSGALAEALGLRVNGLATQLRDVARTSDALMTKMGQEVDTLNLRVNELVKAFHDGARTSDAAMKTTNEAVEAVGVRVNELATRLHDDARTSDAAMKTTNDAVDAVGLHVTELAAQLSDGARKADTDAASARAAAVERDEAIVARVAALAAQYAARETNDVELGERTRVTVKVMGRQVEHLAEEVARIGLKADVQLDTVGAAMREVSRSFAMCAEMLAGESARADAKGADSKAMKRALQDRNAFVETISDSSIRPLPLPRIFPGIESQIVEVGAVDPDTTHVNHVDMLYVCAIARHVRARRIFEFGTYLGRTTCHLALGPDVKEVFTLDLDPSLQYPDELKLGRAVRAVHERGLQGYFFREHECGRLITQLHGDSRTFDYSPYDGRMDFVFVDGGHSYDLVANDTQRAVKMLRPAGVIVWHDFAPKGREVVAFARDFSRTRPLFWVPDTSLLVYVDGVNPMTYDAPLPVYDRSVIKAATG